MTSTTTFGIYVDCASSQTLAFTDNVVSQVTVHNALLNGQCQNANFFAISINNCPAALIQDVVVSDLTATGDGCWNPMGVGFLYGLRIYIFNFTNTKFI